MPSPFAALEQIDELDRLEKSRYPKTDFSEWAAPTVYVRKKPNQMTVCADFSTGLNQALTDPHYPLPWPEEIFNKLNGGKIISKIDYRTHIFKSRWKRILNILFYYLFIYLFFFLSLQEKNLGRGGVMGPLLTHWWTLPNPTLIESQILSSVRMNG